MNQNTIPLVACATRENILRQRIETAARMIGSDFFSSSDADAAIEVCHTRSIACVVVDYQSNAKQVQNMRRRSRSQVVLVAIPSGNTEAAFESARAGAVGVIEPTIDDYDLMLSLKRAIACVAERENRFSHPAFAELTEREEAVLELLMSGEQNKQVAAALDVGLRTAEGDRASIMRKLGVSSFAELVATVAAWESESGVFPHRSKHQDQQQVA